MFGSPWTMVKDLVYQISIQKSSKKVRRCFHDDQSEGGVNNGMFTISTGDRRISSINSMLPSMASSYPCPLQQQAVPQPMDGRQWGVFVSNLDLLPDGFFKDSIKN